MTEVFVEHLGAVQFEIKARQHTIVSDQPRESFGHDEGMTPPELLSGFARIVRGFLCRPIPAQAQTRGRRNAGAGSRRKSQRAGAAGEFPD